ncbi:hypothetical protein PENSTE_c004G06759 [Penicillium steckii]|uniref:Macro-like domain-containing protein n=1 Tax=Penicillium steckii TaxID=303698 RepID=A0A1V6TPW3_9EURO|nr:hypothetical protein PENSTE_c004G06759 [Penicillium steckii]
MNGNIPEVLLLCQDIAFLHAFEKELKTRWPTYTPAKVKITTFNERLNSLPEPIKFDLIVSPANSFGRLDGAFDHAISKTFSPQDDYHAVTRSAQSALYQKWRGFAPPGTCTLVEWGLTLASNSRECRWLAVCPTMKEPCDVKWDREIVFECTWSLLCEVEGHNRRNKREIRSILMTPFAAGVGKVSKERWASQTVLALKQFVESVETPEKWGGLEWDKISDICDEVSSTWKDS